MVIADTGFWVALGNSRDKYHEIATQKFIALSDHGETFVTTWTVMTETCHLLLHRIGHMAQVKFIENYHQGAFEVLQLGFDYAGQIHALIRKYADLPMDLADASPSTPS